MNVRAKQEGELDDDYGALRAGEGNAEPGNDQPQQLGVAVQGNPLNEENEGEEDNQEEGRPPQELTCRESVLRYMKATRLDYLYAVGGAIIGAGTGTLGYFIKSNLPVSTLLIDTAMCSIASALVPFKMRKMWPEVSWQAKAAILVTVSAGTCYVYKNFVDPYICDPAITCDPNYPLNYLVKDNFFRNLPIGLLQRPATHLAVSVTKCLSSLFSRCPEPEYQDLQPQNAGVVRRIN